MDGYLQNVLSGRLPVNHQIIYRLQDIFNLLPNIDAMMLVQSFAVKTNDMAMAIYLASIIRSVIALHNLIDNKLYNKEKEAKADFADAKKKQEAKEAKEGEKEAKEKEGAKEGAEAKKESS